VRLSLDYWESLKAHAVPLAEGAIAALSHNSMALDIYAWLAQRLHRIPAGKPSFIPWPVLQVQFGIHYDRLRDFRRVFKISMRQVSAVYPTARIDIDQRGLTLWNSPPPVAPRLNLVGGKA
jgi:Plasmid encoded RepA protein